MEVMRLRTSRQNRVVFLGNRSYLPGDGASEVFPPFHPQAAERGAVAANGQLSDGVSTCAETNFVGVFGMVRSRSFSSRRIVSSGDVRIRPHSDIHSLFQGS